MSLCLYVSWGDKTCLGFPLLLRYAFVRLPNGLSGNEEIHTDSIGQSVTHCSDSQCRSPRPACGDGLSLQFPLPQEVHARPRLVDAGS